jgi:hypothetical protein
MTSELNPSTTWQSYEQVAEYLLNQIASEFGVGRVEGKQLVPGESGTEWEIDAKGVLEGGEGFVIIECRLYTKSRLNQEQVGGLAYRIKDTGATGGIIVSPLELQSGARRVAATENIQHIQLTAQSTITDYVLQFLNKIFVGFSLTAKASVTFEAEVIRAYGSKKSVQ